MKNKKIFLAVIALVAVAALMVGVYFATRPKTQEGEKTITVTVVHQDGSQRVFTCTTTEDYLAPVLVTENIVVDNQQEYGLYILTADGETVDATAEHWWAVYDGDAMSNYGVSETPIRDGGSYKLVYTVGYDGLY